MIRPNEIDISFDIPAPSVVPAGTRANIHERACARFTIRPRVERNNVRQLQSRSYNNSPLWGITLTRF